MDSRQSGSCWAGSVCVWREKGDGVRIVIFALTRKKQNWKCYWFFFGLLVKQFLQRTKKNGLKNSEV